MQTTYGEIRKRVTDQINRHWQDKAADFEQRAEAARDRARTMPIYRADLARENDDIAEYFEARAADIRAQIARG